MMNQEILIVDDEADIRALTSGILQDEGYQTRTAANSDEALSAIEKRQPLLVLLDIWLQGSKLDGLQILKTAKENHPDLPIVMMSGHGTVETAVSAIKDGAYDFIEKPFKADRLVLIAQRAIEAARLRRQVQDLRQRSGEDFSLIGASPAIKHVRQSINRVAATNSRVLITGPSGCGKEKVARLLHQESLRKDGPFCVINCANMAPERVEMELFGTEAPIEGGDGKRKVGILEAAHTGTLLLDEVTDMPLETQGKVVRVLQEQIFERVGGSSAVEVDVRVIASASKPIQPRIEEGHFREDLFYRLSVVPIEVPALKDRREDIPDLIYYFMDRASENLGYAPRKIGDDAIITLQSYEWPGNVRELRNIVERILIMAPGSAEETIRAEMLPQDIFGPQGQANGTSSTMGTMLSLPLRDAREMFEREYLKDQIERFGGNISKTASFVGMERSALHRKLKQLGIHADDTRKGET